MKNFWRSYFTRFNNSALQNEFCKLERHKAKWLCNIDTCLRFRLLCGAGGYPPNVLQPTEIYCTNPALVSLPLSPEARHIRRREEELWARNVRSNLAYNCDFHGNCRVLLHAEKLRHGTDSFTSPPKEGMLMIFFRPKNPTASAGFEPANLGTKSQHANY
jgi:hypothetical protein